MRASISSLACRLSPVGWCCFCVVEIALTFLKGKPRVWYLLTGNVTNYSFLKLLEASVPFNLPDTF